MKLRRYQQWYVGRLSFVLFNDTSLRHPKNIIHQVTTMLAISKYVLFLGHNHMLPPVLMTWHFDYHLSASEWRVISTSG